MEKWIDALPREETNSIQKQFMAGHLRRKALIQRMVKAGIWKSQ